MNDIRWYVEHLFEGKTMTDEMIELKEEIVGNLTARYEDLVTSGVDEAEAVKRACASVTSVDELLAEGRETPGDTASDGSEGNGLPESDAAGCGPDTVDAALDGDGTPEGPAPQGAADRADDDGYWQDDSSRGTDTASAPEKPRRRAGLIVAGVALGVVLVALIGFGIRAAFIATAVRNEMHEAEQSIYEPGGLLDPAEQEEVEQTTRLDNAVRDSTAASLRAYAATSDDDKELMKSLESFFSAAPLGERCSSFQMANGTFRVRYENVPDAIDDDAVERAVTYDAAAAFALFPKLTGLRVEIQDDEGDIERYEFDRAFMTDQLAQVSGGKIQALDQALLDSEDTWDSLRNHVISERFLERMGN